jgi:hypothetical protein
MQIKVPKGDPVWVVRRRVRYAEKIRRVLYGQDPPFHYDRRTTWAIFVAEMVCNKCFGYEELLDEARKWAGAHPQNPPGAFDPVWDLELLKRFEKHCKEKIRSENRYRPWEWDPEKGREGKARRWAKQDLLDGICPLCGTDLPCTSHGIGRILLDGRGGLIQTETVRPCSSPAPSAEPPPRESVGDA